jgi:stearoyl-CoA desaturase (delta-9 desaturase)
VGSSAGQKGPLSCAASHVRHHRYSDQPGDLHSPVIGGVFHACFGWLPAWGFILSTLLILHRACLVNTVTYLTGTRCFDTGDQSRSVWWRFPVLWGESWHNNHQQYPRSAPAGVARWEFDFVYLMICALEWLGFVWNVQGMTSRK